MQRRRELGQVGWQDELQVGGWQLLVGVYGVPVAVVRVSPGRENGAADAVSVERELQPLQWVLVLAIVGEPEELVCIEVNVGCRSGHHLSNFAALSCE